MQLLAFVTSQPDMEILPRYRREKLFQEIKVQRAARRVFQLVRNQRKNWHQLLVLPRQGKRRVRATYITMIQFLPLTRRPY